METATMAAPGDPATGQTARVITKVLIANRGEIAIRIARACADAGIASVAVYADPDRDALHVSAATEAFALGGSTPGDSYLVQDKLLAVAAKAGADAVHPGYGFLAENASFAQAVGDAGLVWIGPSPAAIDALGDKVKARHIAERAGAPLVAGTREPVGGSDEVLAFADEHGLPVAIKAAYGGGGRGLKVAHTREEIPSLFDSAVREAIAAFGRGECFVEKYLSRPRHVETQCLADAHGASSSSRRGLLAAASAPEAGRGGARAVPDGRAGRRAAPGVQGDPARGGLRRRRHLRVPRRSRRHHLVPRGQHPAAGRAPGVRGGLGHRPGARAAAHRCRRAARVRRPAAARALDRVPDQRRDPGRGFLPAPGVVTSFRPPSGPGVRLDSGVQSGDVIGGAFDSMLAKLVVTGATREQALQRARRALDEFVVEGMPTVLPFHRAVVRDAAFTSEPFTVHTRWIETDFDNQLAAFAGAVATPADAGERERVVVEVDGRRLEVVLPAGLGASASTGRPAAPRRSVGKSAAAAASGDALTAPMQGTIISIAVENGQVVAAWRPDRRPGGDEDGAADHRAQGWDCHRAHRGGRPDRRERRDTARAQGLGLKVRRACAAGVPPRRSSRTSRGRP
jgi:acetyl-CoA/propionyl-CoA carboxylase biotin carboxyl carrier protein